METTESRSKAVEEPMKRRVSISEQNLGIDNPAFDHNRKISGSSEPNSEPGRKRSILHHGGSNHGSSESIPQYKFDLDGKINGNRKKSVHSLSSSIRDKVEYSEEIERIYGLERPSEEPPGHTRLPDSRSWLYLFCARCHGHDDTPSWEPPGWRRACPQPFCPTYRKFARILCLFLVGLMFWGIVYSIIGEDAAPGGPLFGLAALSIAAHFGGWLFSLTTLPALIGMLITGIIFQNVGLINIEGNYLTVVSNIRKIALVIILTRAGLDLDPNALKKLRLTVPKLGLIPWCVEAGVVAVLTRYLLGLPWIWGFLLGSIIAAVSPAVVVPCLFRLRGKGYGVAKGIPTLIIAVSGIDDAASVAIFGIVKSVLFSHDALWYQILQGPIAIVGGLGFGILWGWLAKYVPEKGDPYMVPMRVLMLLCGGLIAVFGSETIELGGAGPLAVVAAAFISCYFWQKQGWDVDDNPVATSFEIFWMIFEPILFGVTGTQIKISQMDGRIVYIGLACLITGIVTRIFATILVGVGSKLNMKEKVFVSFSWMAKATVQAALGPVAKDEVDPNDTEQVAYAEIVLMLCVLSILLTAPTGAVIISLSGPKLLKKTSAPVKSDGWRSRRPSIRDISIINEEIDLEDPGEERKS